VPVIASNASRAQKLPYEKTLRNYTAVVAIGCAMLWLRI
jgi:hypothetical protein